MGKFIVICLIAFIATAEYVVCVSEESEAFIDMSSTDLVLRRPVT